MSLRPDIKVKLLTGGLGSGKTRKVLNFIKNNPDKLVIFLSPSHKTLYEFAGWLERAGIKHAHWKGFTRLCPEYLRPKPNEAIVSLYENYKIKTVCTFCSKRKFGGARRCPYRKQFRKSKIRVFILPFAFINTTPLIKIIEEAESIAYIFIDDVEVIDSTSLLSRAQVNKAWNDCHFMYNSHRGTVNFETMTPEDYIDERNEFKKFSKKHVNIILNSKTDSLLKWINFSKILNPPFFDFDYWHKTIQTYPFITKKRIIFYNLFHAFKLAEDYGSKITIVGCETPTREDFLYEMADMYLHEYGTRVVFSDDSPDPYPDMPRKAPMIRIRPIWRYPKVSLLPYKEDSHESTRKIIARDIVKALRKLIKEYGLIFKSYGVITHKSIEAKGMDWIMKEFFFDNIFLGRPRPLILTYGDFKSSNKFLGVNVVFTLGTYIVNHEKLVELYNMMSREDDIDPKTVKRVRDKYNNWVFEHEGLERLRQYLEEDQMMQAIGRSVPRGVPTIIVGNVPEYVKEEYADVYQEWVFNPFEERAEKFEDVLEQEFKNKGIPDIKVSDAISLIETQTGHKFAKQHKHFHELVRDYFKKYELFGKKEGKRGRPSYYLRKCELKSMLHLEVLDRDRT